MTSNLGMAAHHCVAQPDIGFVALGPAKVAVLGIVQGLTELLPVSSTAHMRAIPALLGWPDPGAAFSASMQLAALLAIVAYFRADIFDVTSGTIHAVRDRDWGNSALRTFLAVVVATVPIAVVGASLSGLLNSCNSVVRLPFVVGAACLLMALVMGACEYFARHRRKTADLTLFDALCIGLAQVGALIPGVSRSGATFGAALGLGFQRQDAARVSFLLGLPAITLAGLHELWVLRGALDSTGWSILILGLIVSSVSAFAAIWGLMRFLEHSSTWLLVIYRAIFGSVLMVGAYLHWIR